MLFKSKFDSQRQIIDINNFLSLEILVSFYELTFSLAYLMRKFYTQFFV